MINLSYKWIYDGTHKESCLFKNQCGFYNKVDEFDEIIKNEFLCACCSNEFIYSKVSD